MSHGQGFSSSFSSGSQPFDPRISTSNQSQQSVHTSHAPSSIKCWTPLKNVGHINHSLSSGRVVTPLETVHATFYPSAEPRREVSVPGKLPHPQPWLFDRPLGTPAMAAQAQLFIDVRRSQSRSHSPGNVSSFGHSPSPEPLPYMTSDLEGNYAPNLPQHQSSPNFPRIPSSVYRSPNDTQLHAFPRYPGEAVLDVQHSYSPAFTPQPPYGSVASSVDTHYFTTARPRKDAMVMMERDVKREHN